MRYRNFINSDYKPSALGFGCMRFPEKNGKIDRPEAEKLLLRAVEGGINYFDTAWPYHNEESEPFVGEVLKPHRQNIKLANKLPCWLVEKESDFDRLLDEQLRRLQTETIDFYLLHALWKDRWDSMKKFKAMEWAEKAKAAGKIQYFGFSFHDDFDLFKQIVDEYDNWDFCQIQYNFLNTHVQAGTAGLEYAAQKGLGVVIMEPLLGGILANPKGPIEDLYKKEKHKPVDLALRWLWNKKEVSVVLSGMSTMEQLEQNIQSADNSEINSLSHKEHSFIKELQKAYKKANPIPCTKCRYCMPCPHGVDIPRNFELYNQGAAYGDYNLSKALYTWHFKEDQRASACTACKECEEKCPQKIQISQWMPKIHKTLLIPEE